MDRDQFIIATAVVLFAAFVLGWFAAWLIHRLTRPTRSDFDQLERLTRQLRAAEQSRDEGLVLLSAAEAARDAALAELRETRIEVEELRDYIEQKFGRPAEEG